MRRSLVLLSVTVAIVVLAGLGIAQQSSDDVTAETRRVFDAYAVDHDTDYYAEDATFIDMTNPSVVISGRDAIAGFIGAFYGGSFGDGRYELVNMVVEGNLVMQESIFFGTHTGPLGTIPATGRTVEFPFTTSYWIEGGEIIWGHLYYDSATVLRQLGVIE